MVHWLTREASVSAPTVWTTIDDYLSAGKFGAAAGLTFSWEDEIFTTETDIRGIGAAKKSNYLTRRGFSGSPFKISDVLASPSPGSMLGFNLHTGQSATTDIFGSISTAGTVRRLPCFSSK